MAASGLVTQVQEDFSAGAFPNYSRDSIPVNGVEDAVNVLITDDGQLQRRGGSSYYTSVNAPGVLSLAQVWDGYLQAGQRTLGILTDGNIYVWDGAAWTIVGTQSIRLKPTVLGNVFVFTNTLGQSFAWGGSTKASYSTGTVALTQDSTTVVGTGTTWTTNLEAGMLFRPNPGSVYWVVASVTDNTHLELTTPYTGSTVTGQAYVATGTAQSVSSTRRADFALAAANRLLAFKGRTVYESEIGNPFLWPTDNYVELPEGATATGAEYLRDTVLIFTTRGIYALSNVAFDLTDAQGNPQQRLEQINRDLILWSWLGVAQWRNALIVPATDGVYLFDGVSQPVAITGGMAALYRSYVAAGYRTGEATVYNNHYLLPVLDSSNNVIDELICRLTPTRRGAAFGWVRSTSARRGYTVRVGDPTRQPVLLAVDSSKKIITSSIFDPAVTTDADGTVHQATIVTRELTGDINTLVKKLRINYELTDPSTTNPTLSAEWAQAGGSYSSLTGAAPEVTQPTTYTWLVSQRNPHFRLQTSNATSNFTLHSVTNFIRPSGRQ